MQIINFKEENHIYTCNGEDYKSVSALWKPYTKPFMAYEVSVKKAFKELDYKNYEDCKKKLSYEDPSLIALLYKETKLDEEIINNQALEYREKWRKKSELGTAFHNKEEKQDLQRGYRLNPFDGKQYKVVKWDIDPEYENQSFSGDAYRDLPDGYVPEWLLGLHSKKLAGQADQVFIVTENGERFVDIDDWKTDEKILLKPDFFNRKTGYQKFNYPFDHLFDTNYWKYTCKISTYAKMLELQGFKVRNLAFTHVVIDEQLEILEQTRYKLPYKSFEVDLAIKYLNN